MDGLKDQQTTYATVRHTDKQTNLILKCVFLIKAKANYLVEYRGKIWILNVPKWGKPNLKDTKINFPNKS